MRVLFKAAWRSGAAHTDMSADKFLARLCALVPPPGFHMTRYFGVFANRHHLRPRIIAPSPVPTRVRANVLDQILVVGFETVAVVQDGQLVPVRRAWMRAFN